MSKTVQEIMEVMGKTVEASMTLERKSGSSYAQIANIKSEDINELRYYFDGALYCSVMRCLEVKLKGNWTSKVKKDLLLDNLRLNLTHPEGDKAEIGYGCFIIAENPEYDAAQNVTSVIAYDELYPSMQPYAMSLDWTNGITVKNYLIAILDKLGINYDTGSLELMANADVKITSEKFIDIENDNTESAYTYRDVLDEIAKASGVTFAFKNSLGGDPFKLYAIKPTESGYIIDESNLHSVTVGAKYGPVKAVMLSREPQEDNVYLKADGYKSTDATVKIANVEIMEDADNDSYRENFKKGILSNVENTEYYLYELDSFGIGFLNFGDIFTLKVCDREGGVVGTEKSYKTIFMRTDMTIGTGVKEKSKLEAPQATSPDYSSAAATDKTLKKTMLKVDKQKQEITAIVKENEEKYSSLKQTVEGFDGKIADVKKGLEASISATAEKAEAAYSKAETVAEAGYITTTEAESLISQSAEGIALSVSKSLKIDSRNILFDSECFKSYKARQQNSEVTEGVAQATTGTPSLRTRNFNFTPTNDDETSNGKSSPRGFYFTTSDLIHEDDNAVTRIKANTTYTLSWWMKYKDSSTPGAFMTKNLISASDTEPITYDNNRCDIPTISTSWQKYTVTFTTPSKVKRFYLRFFFEGCTKGTEYSIYLSSFKLEVGNIVTDWVDYNWVSSADFNSYIKQTDQSIQAAVDRVQTLEDAGYITQETCQSLIDQQADSISLKVEKNIKIGARNILLDSACFATLPVTGRTSKVTKTVQSTDTAPSGKTNAICFKPTSAGTRGFQFFSAGLLGEKDGSISKVRPNITYTLSWWMKLHNASQTPGKFSLPDLILVDDTSAVTYDNNRCNIPTISTSWQKYTATFTTPSTVSKFSIRFFFNDCEKVDGDAAYWIDLSSLKLEEGNVATDWTPSAEDVDQSVKAQISMCVQKDENGKLTSAIAIEGNKISIKSDKFVLANDGTVICNDLTCTNKVVDAETETETIFSMKINQAEIVHTFNAREIGQIGTSFATDGTAYETITAGELCGVWLRSNNGKGFQFAVDKAAAVIANSDTTTSIALSDKGVVFSNNGADIGLAKQSEWSYKNIVAGDRMLFASTAGLVIGSGYGLCLTANSGIWLCGTVRLADHYSSNTKGTKKALYVDTNTGIIST